MGLLKPNWTVHGKITFEILDSFHLTVNNLHLFYKKGELDNFPLPCCKGGGESSQGTTFKHAAQLTIFFRVGNSLLATIEGVKKFLNIF